MKRIISLVLSVTMLLSLSAGLDYSAYANDTVTGSCGENVSYTFDKETGTLTISGTGDMEDYAYSDASPINADSPFSNFEGIKTVIINPGVTSIGNATFFGCVSMENVTIPDSVKIIGEAAFDGCTSLVNFNVDENNTAYCSPNGVLLNKDKTELLQFPIRSENTNYVIPDTVKIIHDEAFYDCSTVKELTIPSSVVSIGKDAFFWCSLENINVDNENSVFSSQDGVLFNKDKTELIVYPKSKGITSYNIPDGVEIIDAKAFHYCMSIRSVTIPESVTEIGDAAFSSCWNLSDISVSNENASFCSDDNALFNKDKTELIQSIYDSGKTEYTVPDTVTKIRNYAFYSRRNLTSVTLPDSVVTVGDYAFNGCTDLASIKLSDNLTTIGEYAFYSCLGLTAVDLPESVKSIGTFAFGICPYITDVQIGENVDYIGVAAFAACKKLQSINVNSNNKKYCSQDGVLYNKDKTELIECPVSCELTELELPNSVTKIADYGFFGCSGLNILVSEGVKSIGMFAFLGCDALKSISIPEGTESIYTAAFLGCLSMETVTIPVSVKKIHYGAFGNCSGIKDVYYGGTKKQWSSISIHLLNDDLKNAVIHCTDGIIDSEHPYVPSQDETDESAQPLVPATDEGNTTPINPSPADTAKKSSKKSASGLKKPARVKIKKVKSGKKRFKIIWKKVKGADGYIIQYSLSRKFKKGKKYLTKTITVKNKKSAKKIVKKLKKNKKYYVRVRAFRKTAKKKTLGKWSRIKSVKVK